MKPTIRYVIALAAAIVLAPGLFAAVGTISPSPYQQVFDNNGNPAALSCVWTYTAGTSSPVATYTDVGLSVANSNPIIANTAGRFTAFLTPGVSYKLIYELAPCPSISHGTNLRALGLKDAEMPAYLALVNKGTAPTEALQAIEAQRSSVFAKLPSDAAVKTVVDAKNARTTIAKGGTKPKP